MKHFTPKRAWAGHTVDVAREMYREWRDDRVGGLAAEVAFFGLLSFFPTLLVLAAALGWLEHLVGGDVADRAEAEVVAFLERVLTDEAAQTTDAVQTLFSRSDPGIFTVGLVVAVFTASRGFVGVTNALDAAYDVTERRTWFRLRLTALGLAVGTAVVMAAVLAVLVLGPLLGTGRDVAEVVGLGDAFAFFWDVLRWPVTLVLVVAWAATVFHLAPNNHTPWRWDLPGAALTAVLWVGIAVLFRLYLAVSAGGNDVLGTVGGALVVVLWLYLMAAALLLGGELNAILAERFGAPTTDRAEGGRRVRWVLRRVRHLAGGLARRFRR
ncbi:MAG: YihY/virulence factor BrkB family protein [Acidimicrobiia bacterium]